MAMGREGDVAFGFNPEPFLNGINQVSRGMTRMTGTVKQAAGSIGRQMFSAVAKVELLKAAIQGATRFVRSLGKYMPELGKAFGIAREVIFKNLLWPLRQELAPMLQNMLDWVRDNRALFLRFGEAIAGAFRAGVQAAKFMWQLLQNLVNLVRPAIEAVFGDLTGGISQAIDLVIAKVAIIVAFISRLLGPVFEGLAQTVEFLLPKLLRIGELIFDHVRNLLSANEAGHSLLTVFQSIFEAAKGIVGFILDMTASFLTGFVPALSQAMTPIQRIVDALADLVDRFFTGAAAKAMWSEAFEFLGGLIGRTLVSALELVADILDAIIAGITWAAGKLDEIVNKGRDGGGGGGGFLGFWEDAFGPGSLRTGGLIGATVRALGGTGRDTSGNDMVITKRGDVIHTSPDDTIIATKSPGGGGRVEQNVTVTLYVTEGNAERAGRNFSAGLTDGLRLNVLDSLVAGGL